MFFESLPEFLDNGVRFGQVLTIRALAFHQIRNGVETETVDTDLEPELHDIPHLLEDGGVVIVEIGLMAEEAMPVIRLRDGVPGPVGEFGVDEIDACASIAGVGVAPDVPVAAGVVLRASRFLKPGVLVRSMVQHQFNDDPDFVFMRGFEELFEIVECSIIGMDCLVV